MTIHTYTVIHTGDDGSIKDIAAFENENDVVEHIVKRSANKDGYDEFDFDFLIDGIPDKYYNWQPEHADAAKSVSDFAERMKILADEKIKLAQQEAKIKKLEEQRLAAERAAEEREKADRKTYEELKKRFG